MKIEAVEPKKSWNIKKIVAFIILIFIGLGIVAYFAWQLVTFSNRIRSNWSELQFAFEKPAIVKAIRTEYQEKQTKLEKEITERQKSAEDKLVEEVVTQMSGKK